jgi:phenylacetate-CoA ligase
MSWIAELVQTVRARIPFYRDHLAGADPASLEALPTFEKSMVARYGRFPMSAGGAAGAYRVLATSGTSGDRLYISLDHLEWQRSADWLAGVGKRAGVTPDDVLLNTHCYGLWVGGPCLDLLAQRAGAGLVPLGPVGPAILLQLLADGIGSMISATPSYLRRLIEAAEAADIDLRASPLRLGFIGAESAEESLRDKLRERLPAGFQWIELYGLTETGGPSIACAPDPGVPEIELNTGAFHLEVLHPHEDRVMPLGEVGELTITTRRPDGRTPLVRYRTRDLVRAIAADERGVSRMSRILGRVDHSLKIGGVLVYPSSIAEIVSGLLPATSEWRAEVHRRGDDDELVLAAEAPQALCQAIERAFRDRVGLTLTVRAAAAGDLARSREKTRRILVSSGAA